MISIEDLSCKHCGKHVEGNKLTGWVVDPRSENPADGICEPCFEIHGAKAGSIQLTGDLKPALDKGLPLAGSFRSSKTLAEVEHFRTAGEFGSSWWEMENDCFELLSDEYPLLKLSISNRDYKELWIKIEREDGVITALTLAGDRPNKGQELTIHQRYRLSTMGFSEIGMKNKDWRIELGVAERTNENVARIMSHVLQFGLFLQPHKNSSINATIDR
jgi:hypothetical protein